MRWPRLNPTLAAMAVSLALSTPTTAGIFDLRSEYAIPAMLELLPAEPLTADTKGFVAHDLRAMRETLDATWPEDWETDSADGDPNPIFQVYTRLTPVPALLSGARIRFDVDPLAEVGASALRIDGIAQSGLFALQPHVSVAAGRGLAVLGEIGAVLAPAGPAIRNEDGFRIWEGRGDAWPGLLSGMRLIAGAPDMFAVQDVERDAAPLMQALQGKGSSFADLPPVAALLEAVEGDGRLVALWGAHADNLVGASIPDGVWPPDSVLPKYEVFAAALAHDGRTAVTSILLVYPDAQSAERAAGVMSERRPQFEEDLLASVNDVSIVAASNGKHTVVVSFRTPIDFDPPSTGPYDAWFRRAIYMMDVRVILP